MADKIQIPQRHQDYIVNCLAHERNVTTIVEWTLMMYGSYYREYEPKEVHTKLETEIHKIQREQEKEIREKSEKLPFGDYSDMPIANFGFLLSVLQQILLSSDRDEVALKLKVIDLASKIIARHEISQEHSPYTGLRYENLVSYSPFLGKPTPNKVSSDDAADNE